MFLNCKLNRRRGITLVELVGVIFSITAGLCIGANYMGLDLSRVAYIAMDETKVLRQIPEDWRPTNPDCPNGDCPSEEEIRDSKRATLNSEFVALRSEVARVSGSNASAEAGLASILDENQKVINAKTKRYWSALRGILAEIEDLDNQLNASPQSAGLDTIDGASNSRAMLVRQQLFLYAQKAIRNLESTQVDPKVLSAGVRLAEWYDDSAELMTLTIDMQRKSAVGDPLLSEKQAFSQAQLQHQKQTELIKRWMAETERYLQTEYGLATATKAT